MLDLVKKSYTFICRAEEFLTSFALCAITFLVFVSAIGRFVGYPINWAIDISLLLFAWGAFLGADIGIRKDRVINVDFLTSKMPLPVQKKVAVAALYHIDAPAGGLPQAGNDAETDHVDRTAAL